jgi:cyclin L
MFGYGLRVLRWATRTLAMLIQRLTCAGMDVLVCVLMQYIALGALFLATKVEECPKKLREVLMVFIHLEQKRQGMTPAPVDIHSQRFTTYKERLIRAERELLKELGFVLYTEHPHKFILNYAKLLTLDDATFKRLAQYAWNFINDSQRTDVCMRYPPETICCAALWMGARVLQIKLPSDGEPPWWELFDAKREDMDTICARVTALYSRPPAAFIDLQQAQAAQPQPQVA